MTEIIIAIVAYLVIGLSTRRVLGAATKWSLDKLDDRNREQSFAYLYGQEARESKETKVMQAFLWPFQVMIVWFCLVISAVIGVFKVIAFILPTT